jgi:hypothetical protein
MKAILLIEDRYQRQKVFFNNYEDLNEIEGLNNSIDNKKNQDLVSSFTKIDECNRLLGDYHLIILHRSYIDNSKINTVEKYAKNNKKDLILFSGGIDQSNYSKEEESQILLINSRDFYSDNLIPFLNGYISGDINNLLYLLYGDNWRLPYLLRYRQLLVNQKYGDKIGEDINEEEFYTIKEVLNYADKDIPIEKINNEVNSIIKFL